MTQSTVVALTLALSAAALQSQPAAPQTPAQCLADVRAYVTKRTQELRPLTSESSKTLTAERTEKVKSCTAKYELRTTSDADLGGLIDLYTEAGQLDLAGAAVARAVHIKTLTEPERAGYLSQSVRLMMREPKSDERNARIEVVVDQLDKLSTAVLDQKFGVHQTMSGYYRGDDIDAGIIKHSNWLIDTGKTMTPDQRKRYGNTIVQAYVNMAEAWAGQGHNDEALALLRRAPVEWTDLPGVSDRITPTLERYLLVGTPGAAISAPQFLNAPAGTTRIDMTGSVTLLEFTAHWCGPCRESYPGINRLRAKFAPRGFRVVMATELYGYFQSESKLDASTEIERDRGYFAEHKLDVPVAIGAGRTTGPDANSAAYKVGGIPQIHLIDRQGRIRLIMVGYDDANEAGLAKLIQKLLAEK